MKTTFKTSQKQTGKRENSVKQPKELNPQLQRDSFMPQSSILWQLTGTHSFGFQDSLLQRPVTPDFEIYCSKDLQES